MANRQDFADLASIVLSAFSPQRILEEYGFELNATEEGETGEQRGSRADLEGLRDSQKYLEMSCIYSLFGEKKHNMSYNRGSGYFTCDSCNFFGDIWDIVGALEGIQKIKAPFAVLKKLGFVSQDLESQDREQEESQRAENYHGRKYFEAGLIRTLMTCALKGKTLDLAIYDRLDPASFFRYPESRAVYLWLRHHEAEITGLQELFSNKTQKDLFKSITEGNPDLRLDESFLLSLLEKREPCPDFNGSQGRVNGREIEYWLVQVMLSRSMEIARKSAQHNPLDRVVDLFNQFVDSLRRGRDK